MNKGLKALIRIEDLLNRLYETDVINDDHTHDTNIIGKALKEYEQYKAIEEELGINLLTFVKVLKAPEIYVKRKNEIFEVLHCDIRWDIVVNSIAIVLEEDKNHTLYSIYHLRDYGKTWALTKEELL